MLWDGNRDANGCFPLLIPALTLPDCALPLFSSRNPHHAGATAELPGEASADKPAEYDAGAWTCFGAGA